MLLVLLKQKIRFLEALYLKKRKRPKTKNKKRIQVRSNNSNIAISYISTKKGDLVSTRERKKRGECYAQAFGRNNNCAKWCYNSTQFLFGFNLVDGSGLVFHRRRRR